VKKIFGNLDKICTWTWAMNEGIFSLEKKFLCKRKLEESESNRRSLATTIKKTSKILILDENFLFDECKSVHVKFWAEPGYSKPGNIKLN
jgi:hypothetical protein